MATRKRPIEPTPVGTSSTAKADDFYKRLRTRIESWAARNELKPAYRQALLALPDLVHLVSRLVLDRRVDAMGKGLLAVALAYAISPIDIIPDVLGPIGFLDDLLVVALALENMLRRTPRAVVDTHWAGSGDIYALVTSILATADKWVGRGMYCRVRDFMASHGAKAPAGATAPPAPKARAPRRRATAAAEPLTTPRKPRRRKPAVGSQRPAAGAVSPTPAPKRTSKRASRSTT